MAFDSMTPIFESEVFDLVLQSLYEFFLCKCVAGRSRVQAFSYVWLFLKEWRWWDFAVNVCAELIENDVYGCGSVIICISQVG